MLVFFIFSSLVIMMRKPCSQPSKVKSHSQVPSWAHTQCCLCSRSLLFSPKHSWFLVFISLNTTIKIALSSFLLETIIIIVITTIIIITMTIITINKITCSISALSSPLLKTQRKVKLFAGCASTLVLISIQR